MDRLEWPVSKNPVHRPLPPPTIIPLVTLPHQPCSYLPDRLSTSRAFLATSLSPEHYHAFMDAGFRRSGRVIYQPVCDTCRLCVPIRIPVAKFTPSKSQRRAFRRNQDLTATVATPEPTDEKFDLYRRYQSEWHGKAEEDRSAFEAFLYESPVNTLEFCYRDPKGKLLAVGICDLCRDSLSSVYLYHDPAESHRSLGTFTALFEIEHARAHNIPYWYLGFWVAGCTAMDYKASFRPHEILHSDGVWRER